MTKSQPEAPDPNCKRCVGTGWLAMSYDPWCPAGSMPRKRRCRCNPKPTDPDEGSQNPL